MKLSIGARLMASAIWIACLMFLVVQCGFEVGFIAIITGSARVSSVVSVVVVGNVCMYFYLELHQDFWCLKPMDCLLSFKSEGSEDFNFRGKN